MIGGKWEVGSRPLAAGSRMSTARSQLLADGRRLLSAGRSRFKYCFSYPYGYIRGSSATDASKDHTLESQWRWCSSAKNALVIGDDTV